MATNKPPNINSPTAITLPTSTSESVQRTLDIIQQELEIDALKNYLTPERVEDLASFGVSNKHICSLHSKPYNFINDDRELREAFDRGRARVGTKIRTKIVEQALEQDNLTAMIHLDKIYSNEGQTQQVEVSVKNDYLDAVPTETLLEIMYKESDKENNKGAQE